LVGQFAVTGPDARLGCGVAVTSVAAGAEVVDAGNMIAMPALSTLTAPPHVPRERPCRKAAESLGRGEPNGPSYH
jgi:hypothetical protein